jgi:hypothetical protein
MSLLTKDTIEGLNRNPRTLIIGLEVAAKQKMLDYEDAIKNNNEREAEKLNAEINEIDERIVEVKAELGEESYEEMRKGNAEGGLTGNQTKIDMNKDGKISSEDFELLRKADGGLLIDDRQQYGIGGKILTLISRQKKIQKELDTEKMSDSNRKFSEKEIERLQKEIDAGTASESSAAIQGEMAQTANELRQRGFSSERIDELLEEAFELRNYSELEEALSRPILKAEGGDIDGQMTMLMMPSDPEEDMLPDDKMEDEYLDFILDEALDSEEEDYLMEMLQGNDRLSEIFDKVIDIAQEFAGSGPVEGPGSGVSDSIPARLSDGEFVFTAKAVDEIGADNLMAMMKDAEMKADERQDLAEGGQPEEEEETVEMEVEKPTSRQDIRVVKTTVDNGGKGLLDEDEISKSIKSKMMLDNRTGRHVQS